MPALTPKVFFDTYYPAALESEKNTKVPALFKLAQFSVESGWADSIKGNNCFGIKANKAWTGEKQLLTTTEFHDTSNQKYPVVISVTKIGPKKWKYKVKDWFRVYPTIAASFDDNSKFLLNNPRYSKAFQTTDAKEFAKEIAVAGYATAPNYAEILISRINKFIPFLPKP